MAGRPPDNYVTDHLSSGATALYVKTCDLVKRASGAAGIGVFRNAVHKDVYEVECRPTTTCPG
ncbi:hypothetical protein [Streptomyces yerevanensis]|uniref:hypothetical protein n=1 Tax=Streptomyces yerevanensis TaxID=66378 RepID=UPI0012FED603|nr:hypothetical protein [Streptomyces yerevanensis]